MQSGIEVPPWAHPRSRGEHPLLEAPLHRGWGSSPLARGTHHRTGAQAQDEGLIPARAGNTWGILGSDRRARAHPRSRGEHDGIEEFAHAGVGSSPLARGTPLSRDAHWDRLGLIPARAGNTCARRCPYPAPRAHPRSRGEHTVSTFRALGYRGSSPLARGTRVAAGDLPEIAGLIPARAGNTRGVRYSRSVIGAHPRSRGEHGCRCRTLKFGLGSSPLARGTLGMCVLLGCSSGLIPARAGNTLAGTCEATTSRAHPRSRGEHQAPAGTTWKRTGSSPLARGTPELNPVPVAVVGLIPARAGNTPSPADWGGSERAHPRSRGEHMHTAMTKPTLPGSSPLARGTQDGAAPGPCAVGLIPARAGNT